MVASIQEVEMTIAALERDIRVLQSNLSTAERASNAPKFTRMGSLPSNTVVSAPAKGNQADTKSRQDSAPVRHRGSLWFGTLRRKSKSAADVTKVVLTAQRANSEFITVERGEEVVVLDDLDDLDRVTVRQCMGRPLKRSAHGFSRCDGRTAKWVTCQDPFSSSRRNRSSPSNYLSL